MGKSLAPLLFASVVLCAVVVWHRDATHIEKACARVESCLTPLRQFLQEHGTLPLRYPVDLEELAACSTLDLIYLDQETIRWAREADGPALIAYGRPNGLIVRANGRAAVFYHDGSLVVEWLDNREIGPRVEEQRRRAGLGSGA